MTAPDRLRTRRAGRTPSRVGDAASGDRTGVLVEFDATERIFTQSSDPRTEAYITGRFG